MSDQRILGGTIAKQPLKSPLALRRDCAVTTLPRRRLVLGFALPSGYGSIVLQRRRLQLVTLPCAGSVSVQIDDFWLLNGRPLRG